MTLRIKSCRVKLGFRSAANYRFEKTVHLSRYKSGCGWKCAEHLPTRKRGLLEDNQKLQQFTNAQHEHVSLRAFQSKTDSEIVNSNRLLPAQGQIQHMQGDILIML